MGAQSGISGRTGEHIPRRWLAPEGVVQSHSSCLNWGLWAHQQVHKQCLSSLPLPLEPPTLQRLARSHSADTGRRAPGCPPVNLWVTV